MSTTKLTADTITDEEIRDVWARLWSSDAHMTALCQTALLDPFRACDEDRTAIAFARGKCAAAINAARAQES